MAHCFESFQKALPRLGALQSSAIAQSIAHGYMAAFDGFGRLAAYSMKSRSDMLSARTGGRHGLHIRLVVIGDDLLGHQLRPLDGLAKERRGTRRVAVVGRQNPARAEIADADEVLVVFSLLCAGSRP